MVRKKLSFLSYSKSEFRGVLVLVIFIAILLFVRIRQRRKVGQMELVINEWAPVHDPGLDKNYNKEKRLINGFGQYSQFEAELPVDPNQADLRSLRAAGLTNGAAKNLIRYREAGGSFTTLEDMYRIYGVDTNRLAALASNFIFKHKVVNGSNPDKEICDSKTIIELNSANSQELAQLPGIGEVLSARIVKYRELLGGYYSGNQLSEVYGLNDSLKNSLLEYLSVDTGLISKTDLNRSSFEELVKHPYLSRHQAKSILEYRRLIGAIDNHNDLINNNIVNRQEIPKLKHYLVVESK